MLPGTATAKLTRELKMQNVKCKMIEAKSMRESVKKAHGLVQDGDAVLLSPAAASFGLFKNEFDRGKQYVDAVKRL